MKTSTSQVEKAKRCMRKWAWGSVHGVWEPMRKAAADGEEVHGHIIGYVKYGLTFPMKEPLGRLAALARDHLPTCADEPLCEDDNKTVLTYAGHEYTLKADIMWCGPSGPVVLDIKKVVTFRYALNKPALRQDHQVNSYALAAMNRYGYDHCTMVWVYLQPESEDGKYPMAIRVVEVVIEREDALAVMRAFHPTVERMAHIKKVSLPIMEVEANQDACQDYKGCYYRSRCFPGMFEEEVET